MNKTENQKHLVQIRIQADESYQIKRVIRAIEMEKGFLLTARSGVKRNRRGTPKLREFLSFLDLKKGKNTDGTVTEHSTTSSTGSGSSGSSGRNGSSGSGSTGSSGSRSGQSGLGSTGVSSSGTGEGSNNKK